MHHDSYLVRARNSGWHQESPQAGYQSRKLRKQCVSFLQVEYTDSATEE